MNAWHAGEWFVAGIIGLPLVLAIGLAATHPWAHRSR